MGKLLSKTRLPLLDCVMRLKRITNEEAAKVAGVSTRTVSELRRRNGKPVRRDLAGYVEQAVAEL